MGLAEEIKAHDFYYEFSDDHSVWRSGSNDLDRLMGLLSSLPKNEATKLIKDNVPEDLQSNWLRRLNG